MKETLKRMDADLVIIGASIGGTLAAYRACGEGLRVVMTEVTDWIGGQFTSQAVPPDEHKYIEKTGCTASYRAYRNRVRDHYRNHPHIIDALKTKEFFCPGGSSVSRLAHPPKLALAFLTEMLEPFLLSEQLHILYHTHAIDCDVSGDTVRSVTVQDADGVKTMLVGQYFIDGTDTGELLPLSGTEYVSGAESRADTGEPLAPTIADPADMQPVTYVAACDWQDGRDEPIEKPLLYDEFRRCKQPYDDYPVLSMYGPDSSTGKAKRFGFFNGESDQGKPLFGLFTYRRIVASGHFKDGYEPRDVTLINWPQNDYFFDNIFSTDDDAAHIERSRQLTLSLIYWLQTEGGYRGLGLNRDVLGTSDGLSKYPYIRESRRIKAMKTVTAEWLQDYGDSSPVGADDSVGVGLYHIDLHITTRSHTFLFREARPFSIPLRCLIPIRVNNLLPASKNVGTTHLTNGCFRLHPVEWNVGESVGLLVAYCMRMGLTPREVARRRASFTDYRTLLHERGIMTAWETDAQGRI